MASTLKSLTTSQYSNLKAGNSRKEVSWSSTTAFSSGSTDFFIEDEGTTFNGNARFTDTVGGGRLMLTLAVQL